VKNIHNKKGISYKYYTRPNNSHDTMGFAFVETPIPIIEMKVTENSDGTITGEIKNLSIKETANSFNEVEDKIRLVLQDTLNHRREFN
tara:strand:+ start:1754 stop:2017 length:264 start_codon:yes stop_codon:yes gene_type:complete